MVTIRKASREDAQAAWDIRNAAIKSQCVGHYSSEELEIWTAGEISEQFIEEVENNLVVLENNNGPLTPLSAEEFPLFCLSFQQEVLGFLSRVGPGEPGSAAGSSVRPSAW